MNSTIHATMSPLEKLSKLKVKTLHQPISNRAMWQIVITSLIVCDLLMSGIAFRAAYFIRFETSIGIFRLDATPSLDYYQRVVALLLPFLAGIFAMNGLYSRKNLFGGTKEYASVFTGVTIGSFGLILFSFLEPNFILAHGWLILAWILSFLLIGGTRFGIRRVVYRLRQRGYFLAPTVIVGSNKEARMIAEQLLDSPATGLHLLGFVSDRYLPGTQLLHNLNVLGALEHIKEIVSYFKAEEIIIATSALSREEVVEIFQEYGVSNGVNLRLSSGLFEIITTGLEVKSWDLSP